MILKRWSGFLVSFMNRINWCKQQSKGIKLIDPNDNLSEQYYKNAEESMQVLKGIGLRSNMWLATTKYYIEYFAVYSVLMKIGVKCEIHDCTIALVNLLEDKGILEKGISSRLEKDKELRIDNQYYLKNKKVDVDYEELSDFLLKIKKRLEDISQEEIEEVREMIEES